MTTTKSIAAGVLEIAYEDSGDPRGVPVILSHGFPYDVRAYDAVVADLGARDYRIVVPFLRGYGPTRYRDAATMRSGQQGALGADLLALLDALGIDRAVLGGYDWGGRAACVVAALHPQRVRGLVTGGGYNVHDVASSRDPIAPIDEHAMWYQYYFHGERGRRALEERRDELCRYLWRTWSPTWAFDDETFALTAPSFANPDFVATVVHSYRCRFGLVEGDPAYDAIERELAAKPTIDVPAISLVGDDSAFRTGTPKPPSAEHFGSVFEERILAGIGHNVPQEAPHAFAAAVRDLL